jgi:hypothetical protein
MARFPRAQSDGEATALGIHLCLYCAVAAGLAFGLYALFQPTRFPNPGVAAYKPLPGTVVTYTPPVRLQDTRARVGPAEPTKPEPETTGLSAHRPMEAIVQSATQAELEAVATPPKRPSRQRPRREAQPESTAPPRSACIPSYDSSGAQTGAC